MEFWLDLALLLLFTLRLNRFVVTDSLGSWWIYEPLARKAYGRGGTPPKWARYVDGLQCGFCVGFWIGVAVLASLLLAGGPGDASIWWRYIAGAFALNWIAGHIASRMD